MRPLRELVLELIEERGSMTVRDITLELYKRHGIKLYAPILSGYLKAMADYGELRRTRHGYMKPETR